MKWLVTILHTYFSKTEIEQQNVYLFTLFGVNLIHEKRNSNKFHITTLEDPVDR